MIYLSIDIETTGLDPINDQVIEFACVLRNKEGLPARDLPYFNVLIKPTDDRIHGNIFAIVMNAGLLKEMRDTINYIRPTSLQSEFMAFLKLNGVDYNKGLLVAGKNFGSFDLPFIRPLLPDIKFKHRYLDPGSMWALKTDEVPPDLNTCKIRARLSEGVSHRALDDARDVVDCIETFWNRD